MRPTLIIVVLFSGCGQTSQSAVAPRGTLIGEGDGSANSVAFTVVLAQDAQRRPLDLAFNPQRTMELWVSNRMDNSVIVVTNTGAAGSTHVRLRDPAHGHFMNKPPAFAFGAPGTFATCGENGGNSPGFMGPALFSSDLAVFALPTPGGLGSHLDMLHDSPFCMGIAHERDNVYWAFDGENSALSRYDFGADHGPGEDDHSDGQIFRYVEGQVKRAADTPSHMVFNAADAHLYVADTGNQRIVKLDTKSGTLGKELQSNETLGAHNRYDGAVLSVIVPPGTLVAPSGLAIHDDYIYVSDAATSKFHAFDLAGQMVRTLDSGLPAQSLAGLTVGPDGKLYFVDAETSRVLRIDP